MVYIRWDQLTHTTHTHTTTEDRDGNIPQARPRSAHPGEVLVLPSLPGSAGSPLDMPEPSGPPAWLSTFLLVGRLPGTRKI